MNIRPKNTILFAQTGVKFSQNNLRGANWRQQVFNNYRQHLLDQLAKYGEADDYGKWLNEMQARHSNIYNLAGGEKGNWEDIAYKNDLVGQYQQDYRGGLGNDGQYKRYGSIQLNDSDRYDFNQTGIKTNQGTRYNIVNPPTRTSGDYSRSGYNYKVDNLYSAITDDRRLLGRKGDWDESSTEFKTWQKDLNSKGWETYLDTSDNYYKLRRLNNPSNGTTTWNQQKVNGIQVGQKDDSKSDFWNKLSQGFNKVAPDLLGVLRLAGHLNNNERVYKESLKAIIPNLQQTYLTHRQVVGDEATKQAYYRRAAQGETRAAQPFTSDADRQIAYMNEAKRVGDELRAQGDLADNQEIRRTSDESNQHQWANQQRLSENTNYNTTERNKAKAAKHQLTAQKYSADWTNRDQYLMGIQSKFQQKGAKQEAIEDQIKTLQMQEDIANDPDIKAAYDNLEAEAKKLYPNGDINWTDPRLKDAKNNLASVRRKSMIKYYSLYAKSGTKLTYSDNTDKYLYRTSRDIVEHFRKMSKITDDSRIKTLPKPIKLTSHPKKRKYQLGGVAPFTIYRPVGVGGETTTQVASSTEGTKSSKDTAAKDKLDMIKEMFKAVQNTGLPVDVNVVYRDLNNLFSRAQAFGEELSSDDIASIYLQSMQKISNLKYSKENYDKALAVATSNESLNELAVDALGHYVVQDKDSKLSLVKSLEEAKEKGLNPITNQQLLNLRAYSPDLAFQRGDATITNIINNGMGINKIGSQIKALAGSLGSTEGKLEGISQVESGRVKAGLQLLAGTQGTPDGHYSVTNYTKDQQNQVQAALKYIENMLSPSQKAILEAHGGTKQNIALFLTSQQDYVNEQTISPLTGKAAKEGKEDDLDKLGINSATQLLLGMSSPREFTFNIGNGNSFTGAARVSSITKDGNPFGADFTYSEIYKSDLHKNLDLDNASFGDVPINKSLKDRIVIDNSTIAGVDLPYTTDRNGRIIPDFQMLNRIEEADQEILRSGIDPNKDPQKVNEIYAKHKLPIKYGADNKLTGNYKRFAVIQATAIEDVFLNKDGLASNGTLTLVSDENEINKYLNELKKATGEKEIDMDRPGLFTGDKDIYKGSIFIPIIGDLVDAVSATGGLKAGNYDELRSKYQTRNYNEAPQFVKQ